MQIFVKPFTNEDGLQEWGIIELQGDLGSKEDDSLAGKFVGDLFYNKDGGAPTFVIGHHILFGKAEKLEKPLAVLEKRPHESGKREQTEYIVKAIVKRKLIFKDRPKPIVGSVALKATNKTP